MPKLKNCGFLGDLVGHHAGARQLDHRADQVLHLDALLGEDLLGRVVDDLRLGLQLRQEADQRDHDFRLDLDAFLLHVAGRLEDGPACISVISG